MCPCAHVGAFLCECLFVLIFAVFIFSVCVCVYERFCGLPAEQTCFGTGTPNSVAAKVKEHRSPS